MAWWAPDGGSIVYARSQGSEADIEVVDLATGEESDMLATPFFEAGPNLSPDGRWLVYFSDESGQPQVYVRPYTGSGGRVQVSGASGGVWPIWSRDGGEIFYMGLDQILTAVSVRLEPTFSVGAREPIVSLPGYVPNPLARTFDVARDGDQFVVVEASAGAVDTVVLEVVVQNFVTELERLAAN